MISLARRPALYALGTRIGVRYLKWLAAGADRIRVLSLAPAWTEGRDFPAPEGRTFRELYRGPPGRVAPMTYDIRPMHKIVFLERDSIRANVRRPDFPHVWEEYPLTTPEQVLERLAGATVAITNKVVLRGELLARVPSVRMIAAAATGTDNIDLPYCREHGIVVSNVRGYAAHTVPEHVLVIDERTIPETAPSIRSP